MKRQYPAYLMELKEQADTAYEYGNPIMPDEEYDAIFGESPAVGVAIGDIPHKYPMYSLQKHYAEDGEPPLVGYDLTESPKLDGCAISLLYSSGYLVQALTRGNGKLGQDVTEKMMELVPSKFDSTGYVQITGELVASKEVANSRNMVAGSLGLNDLTTFKSRIKELDLAFVAYGVQYRSDFIGERNSTYFRDMYNLEVAGFTAIIDENLDKYPTDGKVFRLCSNNDFNRLGFTAKHPRGAYAFKEKQKPVVTKLLDVVWQTGKSGKVTPVAILEPVVIGEANISKATLNNMAFIDALGLEINCQVEVIRAGEIIPTIVGRAD